MIEFRSVWEEWRDVGGFLVGMRRRVEPKNRFLRALAPRIAYVARDVRVGVPLDDAAFAPPADCSLKPQSTVIEEGFLPNVPRRCGGRA